jgi:plasmid stabilization system protein ParE
MTYRVIVEPRAEQEIREAARWIHSRSRSGRTTLRWVKGLRAKVATLKTHPRRCPVHPDSAYFGEEVRVLLYGKRGGAYGILFAIRENTVHVLTVRHSARRDLIEDEPETHEG